MMIFIILYTHFWTRKALILLVENITTFNSTCTFNNYNKINVFIS